MATSKKSGTPSVTKGAAAPSVSASEVALHSVDTSSGCGCISVCRRAATKVDQVLSRNCAAKEFSIPSAAGCASGLSSTPTSKVDLVVLIDTSGSMSDEASGLSAAADAAIKAAAAKCPSDLRVQWFGIEGTWSGTRFTTEMRDHLHGLGVTDGQMKSTPGDGEDGAAAISDLCEHFDWRAGATRAILFLGDEALEGGDPQDNADVLAANDAIADATTASVIVHMYAGTDITSLTKAEYQRVAAGAGGQFFSNASGISGFQAVLERVICFSPAVGCASAKLPSIRPCFELRWGDGPKDIMETEDFEVLCVVASNPYANVCFKNVAILVTSVTDSGDQPVSRLPDGTPSVLVKPGSAIFFGEIPPCKGGKNSSISRELVLKTSGAKAGDYRLHIGVCFDAEFSFASKDRFEFTLHRS